MSGVRVLALDPEPPLKLRDESRRGRHRPRRHGRYVGQAFPAAQARFFTAGDDVQFDAGLLPELLNEGYAVLGFAGCGGGADEEPAIGHVGFGSAVGVVLFIICVTFAFGYRRAFMRND